MSNGAATGNAGRVASIDILRALTMVLMIIVNDLFTLKNTPAWLGHSASGVDGIGVADVVFPAFLFLVGLSLPHALEARRNKGDTGLRLVWHVAVRSFALIVMGVFLVNGETWNAQAAGMHRYWWNPLCCLGFILVWCTYDKIPSRAGKIALRVAGVAGLLALAWIYRGGSGDRIHRFAPVPEWWGILGQIGWAYLVAGLVAIFARDRILVMLGGWLLFASLSILFRMGLVPKALLFIPRPIIAGTLTAFTMGGALSAMIFRRYREKDDNRAIFLLLGGMAAAWTGLYFVTRPYWGLAKIGATPAWLFFCSALTVVLFLAIYWLADLRKKTAWFRPIGPAGTHTLLCYLMPYLLYGLQRAAGFRWPEYLSTGWVGIAKSAVFALVCVGCTGLLARGGIRLKV
ncbi:hypothetical protein OPIT5_20370 [Opitutaceae bacterium TAV5]|nr:hypothetical protein OPIT5_20370 [Opitutaceae bacterium TAV5]